MIFLNDRDIYNTRYRSSLIEFMKRKGLLVRSFGLFDGPSSQLRIIWAILFTKETIISSNMKSNLFLLLFRRRFGIVIVNGLGRYRSSIFFRKIFIWMMKKNCRKIKLVQNYADYRYFRRIGVSNIKWMPGSGGVEREIATGNSLSCFCVTRKEKLGIQIDSILDFIDANSSFKKMYVVGVSNSDVRIVSESEAILGVGYVAQNDIFKFANSYFQPDGYGEGIPHVLVDAIVSGVEIYISKRSFCNYGLYKLDAALHENIEGKQWCKFRASENVRDTLSTNYVNKLVHDCLSVGQIERIE